MVWLHGGGFTVVPEACRRITAKRWRNAAWLWSMINYRLGHLGFFSPILRWKARKARGAYFALLLIRSPRSNGCGITSPGFGGDPAKT